MLFQLLQNHQIEQMMVTSEIQSNYIVDTITM